MTEEKERPLSEQEVEVLHQMIVDYERAKWLRGQLKWWVTWIVGLPVALAAIIQGMDVIIRSVFKAVK